MDCQSHPMIPLEWTTRTPLLRDLAIDTLHSRMTPCVVDLLGLCPRDIAGNLGGSWYVSSNMS